MLAEGATHRELASYLNSEFNDHFGVRVAACERVRTGDPRLV
jgi:hypothetical protein